MLTGRRIIKKRLFGGFNIFVEYECFDGADPYDIKKYKKFRKATIEDLSQVGLEVDNILYSYFHCLEDGGK